MRHAVRIQPYISADQFQKLRASAAARSLTVSDIVGAALDEYLERNQLEDALLLRRLDDVRHAIVEVKRDLDTLAAGFGRFVRYSFFSAPAVPPAEVVRRAESLYGDFLARVRDQLRAGVKFTGQVWRRDAGEAPAPETPATRNGGREEGGPS